MTMRFWTRKPVSCKLTSLNLQIKTGRNTQPNNFTIQRVSENRIKVYSTNIGDNFITLSNRYLQISRNDHAL